MNRFQNILVTGGAGFIGAHFIFYMFDKYQDIKIVNFDKLTYAANLNNLKTVEHLRDYFFVEGDICDAPFVKQTMARFKIDTIVHFAAESHVDRSIHDSHIFVQTNVLGTNNLLQACLDINHPFYRFHHVSTDEVYGSLGFADKAFTELTPYNPSSPYAASKASSDMLVKAYQHTYGLPVSISNCSNNFGAFQHEEKLIPKIIRCCLEKRSIPVYGNGKNVRDWIHVTDHCRAIDMILCDSNTGEQYNIGGECELDNLSLIQYICSCFDDYYKSDRSYFQLVEFVANRPGHDLRYAINNTKIREKLRWGIQIKFDDALRQLVNKSIEQHETKKSSTR